jgi:hypothetical protein
LSSSRISKEIKSRVKEYNINGIEIVVPLRKEIADAALQYFI